MILYYLLTNVTPQAVMLPIVNEYVEGYCFDYEDDDIIIFYSIFFKYYIA